MKAMLLKQLKYFISIVEKGNFTEAAEENYISQSAISQQIQSLENELHHRWMNKSVATIVTQIAVDPNDPAFENPSKPVGDFYTKEQADEIAKEKGYTFKEDAGRGYRQVVPSPLPMKIMELDSIKTLIDADKLVIAGGGGGVPVIITDKGLEGVPADHPQIRRGLCNPQSGRRQAARD